MSEMFELMKENTDIEKARQAVVKMMADKDIVRSYLKGEIDSKTLKQKGVKLAKPI